MGTPAVEPLYFGEATRQLFGIFHLPRSGTLPRKAVLLCNAFGQEAIRSHRMQRVLAQRLAATGCLVLRFDYFGTGDSMGEDRDVSLDGWCQDIECADQELRRRAGAVPVVWIGLALGATAALRMAATARRAPARVIAWDPLFDGGRYLARLGEQRLRALAYPFANGGGAVPAARDEQAPEANGFALSMDMCRQLAAIAPERLAWPGPDTGVMVVSDSGSELHAECTRAIALAPRAVIHTVVCHGVSWVTEAADGQALVPANALAALLGGVDGP